MAPPAPTTPTGGAQHPLTLLRDGHAAFEAILKSIRNTKSSLRIKAFVWRDDAIGNAIAQAVFDAAERGVQVTITKDRIAVAYEYSAGSHQSFFHKNLNSSDRFQAWFLGTVYRRNPKVRPRPNRLSDAIQIHPNINISCDTRRFDHAKVFIFDDQDIILGSMGIGDAHHTHNAEMAVLIRGRHHVDRFRNRIHGLATFDRHRDVDFLVHTQHNPDHATLLNRRLELIEEAAHSLTVEMAYWGDARFTRALIDAVKRGVHTTIVTSKSDVLGHLSLGTCNRILQRTGAPPHLKIFVLPNMVHTKVVVVDKKITDIGSANFTKLSHGIYDEINAHINCPLFAEQTQNAIHQHAKEQSKAHRRIIYRPSIFMIERAIVGYQSRRGFRFSKSPSTIVSRNDDFGWRI